MQQDMNFLDRNEFNFEPSEEVVKAFKNFDIKKLCFYTRIYGEGKKSIFSDFLSERYDINEQQIILGYGAEDLLKQAVHYFLTEGGSKTMLIPKYSWWYYKSIADEVAGTTLQYPVYENGDTFCYDFEGLKAMVDEVKPKILLVASPNNPTGNGLEPSELERLLQMVQPSTIVLVDEAYASFVSDDTSYVKKLVETYSNVVICRTLSKFYGLPGLRMGFGFVGRGEEMDRFTRYSNKYLGYDRLSEEIAIAALKSEEHYRHVANVMQEAREMYNREIAPLNGFKVYRSVANFILIKYPIELKEALQQAFADQSYKIKFMDEPGINTHMRITLGRREQNRTVCDTILHIAKQQ
ncbi:pyridoxal phosphate-dependent aminotransferase [Phocaeicola oris]|uniref:pyridoxal phosphate-dependent aminotransferase n=1 Tax=Phocaeicola oris TaxID=2896850 RepID=UPI00234F8D0C|nr:histidinol-phosphate transaminase [Phocaeicola oris]MCE2616943.1 histidinol-phosphate aminotransferase family protein [Phocaeicola oris]